mmetsp:Transcript_11410/g.17155  ORF Transcript_11410/g.17155 Transcript_11410/m.17155 type:complete len:83 (+) Transcript_11410:316-564(+)
MQCHGSLRERDLDIEPMSTLAESSKPEFPSEPPLRQLVVLGNNIDASRVACTTFVASLSSFTNDNASSNLPWPFANEEDLAE